MQKPGGSFSIERSSFGAYYFPQRGAQSFLSGSSYLRIQDSPSVPGPVWQGGFPWTFEKLCNPVFTLASLR